MAAEFPMKSVVAKALAGVLALGVFAWIANRAESIFFADRLSKIPLFGTELAIKSQPADPQYEYELGNYWMIAAQQPRVALPHFERATQLDPHNGHYWGAVALAYQQSGDAAHAEDAAKRSLNADPTTPALLWQAANVYSFLGDEESAIDAIHRFVSSTPEQAPLAAQLGWRATRKADLLMDRVLPRGWKSDLSLLIALVRAEDPEASARIQPLDTDPNNLFVHNLVSLASPAQSDGGPAAPSIDLAAEQEKARADMLLLIATKRGRDWTKTEAEVSAEHQQRLQQIYAQRQSEKQQKVTDDADVYSAAGLVWKRLMGEPERFDIRFALPYIQMLVDADLNEEAQEAWSALVARESRLKNWTDGKNLIKNASFENEILNGGFDWQYTPSKSIDLGVDHRSAKEGSSSLLMTFKDKPVADAGIVQYVPVKPTTEYEFSGYQKTDSMEAATGTRFRVQDADSNQPYFESSDIRGTTGWTRFTGRFTTSASARFVMIQIVRDPGNTLIKGQVWADALTLVEVGAK